MSGFNRGKARSGATPSFGVSGPVGFERFFYEKVIKVKADVAVLLN